MTRTKTLAAAVLMGAAVATAAPIALADPVDDAIQARRGYYRLVVINFGPLVGMAKGEVDYDADAAAASADNIAALAQVSLAPVFPAGSDNAAKAGATRALPAIWENFDDVSTKIADFQTAAAAIAEAAPNGLDALRPAVGALGATCKACHDNYRAKSF